MTETNPPLTAIIHDAGGAIGSATADAFAARGAHLPLAGRRTETLEPVAERARHLGAASVSVLEVDAYDEDAVEAHAAAVARDAGGIDVTLNAVGIPLLQGVPLAAIGLEDVLAPATNWLRTQFITSRAAARHMTERGSGTILTLSASPARMSLAGPTGFAAGCAAVEALTRTFAAEVGPSGVRAVHPATADRGHHRQHPRPAEADRGLHDVPRGAHHEPVAADARRRREHRGLPRRGGRAQHEWCGRQPHVRNERGLVHRHPWVVTPAAFWIG